MGRTPCMTPYWFGGEAGDSRTWLVRSHYYEPRGSYGTGYWARSLAWCMGPLRTRYTPTCPARLPDLPHGGRDQVGQQVEVGTGVEDAGLPLSGGVDRMATMLMPGML